MNYPRIPTLDPRAQGEDVQGYGLRALLFVMATDCTGGVDDEGLELAHYVFPLAVSARDLSTSAAERLATTQRRILPGAPGTQGRAGRAPGGAPGTERRGRQRPAQRGPGRPADARARGARGAWRRGAPGSGARHRRRAARPAAHCRGAHRACRPGAQAERSGARRRPGSGAQGAPGSGAPSAVRPGAPARGAPERSGGARGRLGVLMPGKQYDSRDQATAAWLRRAKRSGTVQVLGGGWWRVQGWRRPVQGLAVLAWHLERRGLVRKVPARDQGAQATGLWAWELADAAPGGARGARPGGAQVSGGALGALGARPGAWRPAPRAAAAGGGAASTAAALDNGQRTEQNGGQSHE